MLNFDAIRKDLSLIVVTALSFAATSSSLHGDVGGQMEMTVDDCITRALEQNLGRITRQMELEISDWNVKREWAAFEPSLVGSARDEENSRQNTVEQFRNQLTSFFEEENKRYDLGVEGQFFSGARYRLGYSLNDLANNLTNSVVTDPFENEYQSFLGATITQPLLQGGGMANAMAGVDLARAQKGMEFQNLRREMMGVAAQTAAAYWDLASAEELLKVRGNSAEIAEKILEDNRARNKQGKMSEVEVMQAEVSLADRLTRKNEAKQQRIQAMSRLRIMFSDEMMDGEGEITTKGVPEINSFPYEFAEAMELATRLQPDYLVQLEDIKQNGIKLAYAKNQRWPQLDLIASYGFNGLGESVSDSWDEVTGQDYEAWSVGVQFSIGLGGGRKERSEYMAAQLRHKQSLSKLKEVEVAISRNLQSGIQECQSLMENIKNISHIVDVRKRLLDVEMERLNAGRSDSRSVFSIEEDYLQAKEAYANSVNEFQKAILRLELSSGITLVKQDLDLIPKEQITKVDSSEIVDRDFSKPLPISQRNQE